MNKIFIIEHLEPELYEWCIIEYKHIAKIVGKKNLWFTNIRKADTSKLAKYGKVFEQSIKEITLEHACILDPEAATTLSPTNARPIQYFIFGGILGDYPPRKRTEQELSSFLPTVARFNIGKEQMSTDNAVYTVKEIIEGTLFTNLEFQDSFELQINDILSTNMPYRYNVVNGKPLISRELVRLIKKRDSA